MKKILFLLFIISVAQLLPAQNPDRSKPPALGRAKNLQLPPIQKFALSNGLQVVLVEKHSVPLAQVNLLVRTGAVADAPGKEGLSNFALDLMDEGANGRDALQLADEIEFLGASISTSNTNFASRINCSAPVSKLDDAMRLMSDIAIRPTFAEKDIERIRKLRLSGLLQNYDEPNAIAQRAFDKFFYADGKSYGRYANEASIKSYTKTDLEAFHKANFVTGLSTIIVVGDVNKQSFLPILEKYFGTYPKGQAAETVLTTPQQVKGRAIYIVDKPGAAQSVIRIGRLGPSRLTPDFNSAVVMNTILGGSFTSRLNNNLREQHGYAYGASSGFAFWPAGGPFTAASSVQTDVTGPALGEFFNEFNKMRKPLPAEDVTRGKNYDALRYPGGFETNSSIANALADLIVYRLDDNYFNTYVEKTLAVTQKDVEAAAKKYVVPDNMLVIIVGDRSKIEEGIRKLNLGKITVLSVEDILGKKPEM
jgi:zinc protease